MSFYYLKWNGAAWTIGTCGVNCLTQYGDDSAKFNEIINRLGESYVVGKWDENAENYQKALALARKFNAEGFGPGNITARTDTPAEQEAEQTNKKQVRLILGLWNPLNTTPDPTHIQSVANAVSSVIGWDCVACVTSKTQIDLTFTASGTPVLPIAAIIIAVIAAIAGAAVISYDIRTMYLAKEETEQLKTEANSLKDVNDLQQQATQELQAGRITGAQYTQIMQALSNVGANISDSMSNTTQQEQNDSPWDKVADAAPIALAAVVAVLLLKS